MKTTFTRSLRSNTLFILLMMSSSCKKAEIETAKEPDKVPIVFSYEVTCDYCDISYTDATNQIKTVKSNMGKWTYKIEKQVAFDLKLSVSTIISSYQSIHAYILKDETVVYGNLGYNRADISYSTASGNGTSSFGNYVSNTSTGGNNTGGTTAPSSSVCGAKNKTGGYCKRVVVGGGRCWQHK
ncbi:hypothetical protein [Pedobacter rhodius]|uniref:HMA domain-containing protein n=1 Tax=Pedobacter rhodius TaxID=3004098 RepID=A0ABT4KYY6_9SPHI|nr:hypothetical protein [Pedobacter sp. SJ11]MCZ4224005.1 hypothetical protein [Pedobacter sp. SJ11]